MASHLPPIGLNESTTSDVFEADLGREYEVGGRLMKLVKASVAIAASSGSKVLAAVTSSNLPTGAVILNVTSGNHLVCGTILSTHTNAIAASAYFLMMVQGSDDVLVTASGVASVTSGTPLMPGTGSDLNMLLTGATAHQIAVSYCGVATEVGTGTTIIAQEVTFRAPFRFSVR